MSWGRALTRDIALIDRVLRCTSKGSRGENIGARVASGSLQSTNLLEVAERRA